jgi:hypothetical protein
VCNYVEANKPRFENSVANESFAEYLTKMRELTTWGDEIEIAAMADMYNIEIVVCYASGSLAGSTIVHRPCVIDANTLTTYVLYSGGSHYSALIECK